MQVLLCKKKIAGKLGKHGLANISFCLMSKLFNSNFTLGLKIDPQSEEKELSNHRISHGFRISAAISQRPNATLGP